MWRVRQAVAVQVDGYAFRDQAAEGVGAGSDGARPVDVRARARGRGQGADAEQRERCRWQAGQSAVRDRKRGGGRLGRDHAVRGRVRLHQREPRIALGAVEGVDRSRVLDLGVEVTDRRVQAQAFQRLPDRLELGAVDFGVDVLVDRGPVDDLRNLVAFIVVVEPFKNLITFSNSIPLV